MIGTLVEALTAAASDDSLRAVHLRGAGDDFCAGSDWVAANDPGGQRPRTGDLVRRVPHAAHRVIELVAGIQLPVVCSVRGWAVGFGCNLALAADFTVAADDAVFWSRSSTAASARTRGPPGWCRGSSAWRGPGGCCCSVRR